MDINIPNKLQQACSADLLGFVCGSELARFDLSIALGHLLLARRGTKDVIVEFFICWWTLRLTPITILKVGTWFQARGPASSLRRQTLIVSAKLLVHYLLQIVDERVLGSFDTHWQDAAYGLPEILELGISRPE